MPLPDAPAPSWQRLLALSGVLWFASGGDTPDHGATDEDWGNTLPILVFAVAPVSIA